MSLVCALSTDLACTPGLSLLNQAPLLVGLSPAPGHSLQPGSQQQGQASHSKPLTGAKRRRQALENSGADRWLAAVMHC